MSGTELVSAGVALAICSLIGLAIDRQVGRSRLGRRFAPGPEWHGWGRGRYLWFKSEDGWTDLRYQLAMVAVLLLIAVAGVLIALALMGKLAWFTDLRTMTDQVK